MKKFSSQNPALWVSNVRLCLNAIKQYLEIKIGNSSMWRILLKTLFLYAFAELVQIDSFIQDFFCFQILLCYTETQLLIPIKLGFVMTKISASILGFET